MRLTALLALLVLAAPAQAAEVRVKSKHDKVTLSAAGLECQKVGPEETLRAGVIGPGSVKVTLRRLGDAKSPPIAVKLMRDGREVGKLSVGGKLRDGVAGDNDLAGPPLDKAIDIPAGPHTLFVEVGAGTGAVLVSFDEVHGAAPLAAKPAAKPEPVVAAAKPEPKPKPEPVLTTAKPKPEPKGAKPATTAKPEAKAAPVVATASKLEEDGGEPERPQAQKPAHAAGKLEEEGEPAGPQPARTSKLEDLEGEGPGPVGVVEAAPQGESPVRVVLGPRVGIATQPQLGAAGPALGLSLRIAVAGTSRAQGTKGLLIGLSADFLRYGLALKVAQGATLPAFTEKVTVLCVPILLDATYSFGNPEQARLTPYLGLAIGVAAGSQSTENSFGGESRAFARLAFGVHAGVELPIGRNRLGVEVRWLFAQDSTGDVHGLDVGGFIAQATWRFGL